MLLYVELNKNKVSCDKIIDPKQLSALIHCYFNGIINKESMTKILDICSMTPDQKVIELIILEVCQKLTNEEKLKSFIEI